MTPRTLLRTLVLVAVLALGGAARAAGEPWPSAPYSYGARQAKLETVLADFATAFGLSLSMRPDVTGSVSGQFSTRTPTEFITKLSSAYGFVWYTHAGTLHVSRASDVVTRGVSAPGGNVANMRKALTDLGVLESRFGWGELAEQGVAMISGPPSYVQLIEETLRHLPQRAQQLRVFKLKHASAEDRVVSYRDQQLRTPGLASVLKSMVAGTAAPSVPPALPAAAGPNPLRTAPGLPDLSSAPQGAAHGGGAASASPASPVQAPVGPAPTVHAEARLNAVIVQDVPERMPLYEALIAELDVPTALVEIEAMIVDISSDRANELGVDWSGRIGKLMAGFGTPSVAADVTGISYMSGPTVAASKLVAQLHALETQGDAEIRSRPSVLTAENLSAMLDLSETFYIRAQGERVASVTPITSGTTLRVSPHVLQQDGRTLIQLKIDIEDGTITGRNVDSLPIVAKTSVSTEATVRNGEALLIAGYASDHRLAAKTQLPLLGDLPGLGKLFSKTSRTLQKRERLFLIQPKVVGAEVR